MAGWCVSGIIRQGISPRLHSKLKGTFRVEAQGI
jgi:hypothetical protein